jgi:pimeloyl-ACP methyl ester carboxylesterase
LAPHAEGWAVDLPGFGRSLPLRSGLCTPTAYADAVTKFLDELPHPVHLIGNSLGGLIALMVASARPDLARTLTLLAPALPDLRLNPRRLPSPRVLLASIPALREAAPGLVRTPTAVQRVQTMRRLCYADPDAVPEHRIRESIQEVTERAGQPWAAVCQYRTTVGLMRSWLRSTRLWSMAAAVNTPTLLIWGKRDQVLSPKVARRAASILPTARLLELSHAGHLPHVEQPVTVARAVLGLWHEAQAGQW